MERPTVVAVVAERVAELDVVRVLVLDHEVRPTDCPRLRVELLPVDLDGRVRIHRGDVLVGGAEHPARPARRIQHSANHAWLAQRLVVWGDQQVHHQLDDLTRCEVLTCGLVGLLGEPPDQFLEDVTHLVVVDDLRPQIQIGERAGHLVEQVSAVKFLDLLCEVVALQDLVGVRGETTDVLCEVPRHMRRVSHDRFQREGRGVVKAVARRLAEERVRVEVPITVLLDCLQDLPPGRLQHAFESSQHRERQDHLAVVGLFVVTAQQIGDRPGVVRQLGVLVRVQRCPSVVIEDRQCCLIAGGPPARDQGGSVVCSTQGWSSGGNRAPLVRPVVHCRAVSAASSLASAAALQIACRCRKALP